jgi:hypothetical protein
MAALTSFLIAGVAVGIAGTIAGSVTAGIQGAEQSQMADYNQELAEQQAAIQAENAQRASIQANNEAIAHENDSAVAAELERDKMKRIKALNRARDGASGLTMEGTPLMMQIEAAENIELNYLEMIRKGNDEAAIIRYRGELTAYGHEAEALNSKGQAASYGNMSSNALVGGGMQAGTSIVKGTGNAVSGIAGIKSLAAKTTPAKTSFMKQSAGFPNSKDYKIMW